MNETTFENAKVGDRVYSPLFKSVNPDDKTNMTIISINEPDFTLDIKPDIRSRYFSTMNFRFDGSWTDEGGQVLFWENPIKEIPVRPKRMVKKKGFIGIRQLKASDTLIATTTNIHTTMAGVRAGNEGWDCKIQPIEFEVEE